MPCVIGGRVWYVSFNPRAREGRDVRPAILALRIQMGFNPRAREGRDLTLFSLFRILKVSIHAPARGATPALFGMC